MILALVILLSFPKYLLKTNFSLGQSRPGNVHDSFAWPQPRRYRSDVHGELMSALWTLKKLFSMILLCFTVCLGQIKESHQATELSPLQTYCIQLQVVLIRFDMPTFRACRFHKEFNSSFKSPWPPTFLTLYSGVTLILPQDKCTNSLLWAKIVESDINRTWGDWKSRQPIAIYI